MSRFDFTPYRRSTVGFDRLFDVLENQARANSGDNYPPFNIERRGDDDYRITLAVAGFKPADLDITAQQNLLTIQGKKRDESTIEGEMLHLGIANRGFERRFELADYVRVENANLEDGLLVIDLAVNLPVIDAREFRYHRRDITLAELTFDAARTERDTGLRLDPGTRLHVYEARTEHPETIGPSPILRSYLDAVMQGFLNEFGEGGVHRFVAETDAFHMPIHEDRHRPIYPRAVTLSAAEAELFDLALGRRTPPVGN